MTHQVVWNERRQAGRGFEMLEVHSTAGVRCASATLKLELSGERSDWQSRADCPGGSHPSDRPCGRLP